MNMEADNMKKQELWTKFNREHADFFMMLWERWQEERMHEDFEEYKEAMKKRVPEMIKMTKRPFAITCKCDDGLIHISCRAQGNYLKIFGKSV